jgi:hypothetical protein
MEFKNEGKFLDWLKEIITAPEIDEQAYLEDVAAQYAATGMAVYEVRGYATKTGNPAEYRYDVVERDNGDDTFTTIITF